MKLKGELSSMKYYFDDITSSRNIITNGIHKLNKFKSMVMQETEFDPCIAESLVESVDNVDIVNYYDALIGCKLPLHEMYTMSTILMNNRKPDDIELDRIKPLVDKVQDVINYLYDNYQEDEILDILDGLDVYQEELRMRKNNIVILEKPISDFSITKTLSEMALLETANDSSKDGYFLISKELFDIKDPVKLYSALPRLHLYFRNLEPLTRGTVKNCEILLRYLYHKFITYPTYMKKLASIISDNISIVENITVSDPNKSRYSNEILRLMREKVSMIDKQVNLVVTEAYEYDVDIIVELGLEDTIIELAKSSGVPYDVEYSNYVMVESFASIKAGAKEKLRRADAIQKKGSRKLDNTFQRILDWYRKGRKEETEDSIIKSTVKLSKWVKRALIAGGLNMAFGPIYSLLYIVVNAALHAKTQHKYKQVLLNDLKAELKIVEEKIRDAERNDDNKAKYKLMRLKNQLETSINKIVLNIKTSD